MRAFRTLILAEAPVVTAPDGSRVRVLLDAPQRGSMACFELDAGQVAAAVVHRSVDELWWVAAGRGALWRRGAGDMGDGAVVDLQPGMCVDIPCGTTFQFRAAEDEALRVLGVTMPPWPGADEAQVVPGRWTPRQNPAHE
jgi:mannose-6-phosphate isomerase-like protein (cupin superfamily)